MNRKTFITIPILALINSMCAKVKINSPTGKHVTQNSGAGNVIINTPPERVLLIVFQGESNMVGYALNSDAPGGELGTRSKVTIWNNTSNVLQILNIGTNNAYEVSGDHGPELGLANYLDAGNIGQYSSAYLCKTAKGGTKISDWNVGGTNWNTMVSRISGATAAITALGKTYKMVWWYSQGINDVPANTIAQWKTDTIAHFAALRSLYGSTLPIFMSKFVSPMAVFNTAMDQIDAADPYTEAIDYTTSVGPDGYHWNYAGCKDIANKMIAKTLLYI